MNVVIESGFEREREIGIVVIILKGKIWQKNITFSHNAHEIEWQLSMFNNIIYECCDHGVRIGRNVSKTPQHNGVGERMNRTICE